MSLNFSKSNTDNQTLPYKQGPPTAYLAHIHDNQNRKMIEDVDDVDTNVENAKS